MSMCEYKKHMLQLLHLMMWKLINKQTKEEIKQENVSFDETIKQTNEVENAIYHTTTQTDDVKPTTFIDPVTKNML